MKILNKFGFVNKIQGENIPLFSKISYYSDTDYKFKRAIILMKLKYNYFVLYR